MPALLVDTTNTTPRPASSGSTSDRSRKRSESSSPSRPPVSPITPTAPEAHHLPPLPPAEPRPRPNPPPAATFRPQPPSVAISDSENPDAIALRSAISLLQLQREKSKRDLKALAELKSAAAADPAHFARAIQEQRAQAAHAPADVLTPTLAGLADPAQDEHEHEHEDRRLLDQARKDSADMEVKTAKPKLPAIPQPQNIVRCPPVNWAKYHIVGEPLDKLHEEQKKWPGQAGARAPPHTIAAPYSPFTDGIGKTSSTPHAPKNPKKSPS